MPGYPHTASKQTRWAKISAGRTNIGENFKKLSLGALPLAATPAQEGNAGAAAGINACINAMNFSPPVKVLLYWRRPVQRLVVLRSSFFFSLSLPL